MAKLLVLAAAAAFAFAAPAVAGERTTVVELYTSQGCNSCPPADAILGDLADRDDVIALSFHIDYWDYLGWKDTFSSAESTARQKQYARFLGARGVYTPQMVIGGVAHAVGSRRGRVKELIDAVAARDGHRTEVSLVDGAPGEVLVQIGDAPPDFSSDRKSAIWLVRFDSSQTVPIERGENAGRTITYHRVVRGIERIGWWKGEALELSLQLADLRDGGRDGCAIIVQQGSHGQIFGAAEMSFAPET
jgi:hypothetical protein